MKSSRTIRGLAVGLAVIGFCLPQPLFAGPPQVEPTPEVIDVALNDGGLLLGQVVNPQGLTTAKTPVTLAAGGRRLAVSPTDANGNFAFSGLRGGVYQLSADQTVHAYRLWAPGTAPPSAKRGVLLITGSEVTRGAFPRIGYLVRCYPVELAVMGGLVGGGVGAIIATSTQGGPFTIP